MTDFYDQAVTSMKSRRFNEAIEYFAQHLNNCPGDFRAKMQAGICHFLMGSEQVFFGIYRELEEKAHELEAMGSAVNRLWKQYQSLAKKALAAAAIASLMTTAGCQSKSAEQVVPTTNEPNVPALTPQAQPVPTSLAPLNSPKDVTAFDASKIDQKLDSTESPAQNTQKAETKPVPASQDVPAVKPKNRPKPRPSSKHKYSAGVYLDRFYLE